MAVVTLNDLPPALALNGSELVFIYQYSQPLGEWVTYSCTSDQIANLYSAGVSSAPSMRQLVAALANQGVLAAVISAVGLLAATNSYSIAWTHGYRMSISDPFTTGFLQPTLSYTQPQMVTLFALALTFPA